MADVQESPAPTPAPEGVKVFVGNLSFQVGKEELEKEFSEAGKVLSANIIMRGSRSRGYGFVEMATNEEAQKALELNKREIDGRQVNVELAKPREEIPEAQEGEEGEAPKKPRGRGRSRGRGRGRRGRGRGPRGRGEGEEGEEGAEEAAAEGEEQKEAAEGEGEDGDRPRWKRKGGRKGRSRAGRGRGRGRGRGAGKSEELREPSADTLFVANLPFATDDEDLKNFFGKYNPTKAYVVVGRNGRSKGFGFVTFENNNDQQNALQLDGDSLLGRAIAVRVALNPAPQPEQAEEAGDAAAPAEDKNAEEPKKE